MRTKTRLTLWLGMLFLLVLVLAAVGLGTIWKLRAEGKDVLTANYNSIEYAQRMLSALDEVEEPQAMGQALKHQLKKQSANITEVGEAELTGRLIQHIDELEAGPADPVLRKQVRRDLNGIIELNRSAIVHKAALAEQRAERAVMWISIVGTVSFLIAFTLFLNLPGRIAEPIRRLTEGIDRIAEGQYRERVEIADGGEFGHMADRFNAMATELERWENSNLARIMDEKSRAEAVINSLQDASIGVDDQGRILFVNRQALELLGLDGTDTTGRVAAEVAQRNDLLRHALNDRSGSPFKAVLSGKENYFVCGSTPIQGRDGQLGTVITVRNITPFQERDLAKTNFLATISHELKTPLSSTDIGLALLERKGSEVLTTEQKAILADLRKDHQRLVRIVGELLDLSQLETGNIRVNVSDQSLGELIDRALEAVRVTSLQKEIRFDRSGDHGALVKADPDKGVWVLVNVLGNAVRHSLQRGVITIGTIVGEGRVSLAISDQGPGVPAAEQPHLFERFTPGRNTQHGTGLGLSIASEFMHAMGGGIRYEPAQPEGATFVLAFTAA